MKVVQQCNKIANRTTCEPHHPPLNDAACVWGAQVRFNDATEVVLCSRRRCVTFVDAAQRRSTFHLASLPPDPELVRRLKYTKGVLLKLITNDRHSAAAASSARLQSSTQ